MKHPEDFKQDWAALTGPGRIHYRRMYRDLRRVGALPGQPEDRRTAKDHVQIILHIQRNQAWSQSHG